MAKPFCRLHGFMPTRASAIYVGGAAFSDSWACDGEGGASKGIIPLPCCADKAGLWQHGPRFATKLLVFGAYRLRHRFF
jgi:hypothetical protein